MSDEVKLYGAEGDTCAYLEARGGGRVTVSEICEALAFKKTDAYNSLARLVKDGRVEKLAGPGGGFRAVGDTDAVKECDKADSNIAGEVTPEPPDKLDSEAGSDAIGDLHASSQVADKCDKEAVNDAADYASFVVDARPLPPFAGITASLDVQTSGDPEVDAIALCSEQLAAIDEKACRRVLWYLTDRYGS
ncbi:MAG: hypothetical protein WC565_07480 [Parcubacteria group bacterium]